MKPTLAAEELRRSLTQYLTTTFALAEQPVRESLERFLNFNSPEPHVHVRSYADIRLRRGRKGERRSFSKADYAALLDAAHQQLGGPIVVVWDNSNTHVSAGMRALIEARSWLTVIRLPAYAPELNPVEAVWAHLKRSLANLAKKTLDELARLIKAAEEVTNSIERKSHF